MMRVIKSCFPDNVRLTVLLYSSILCLPASWSDYFSFPFFNDSIIIFIRNKWVINCPGKKKQHLFEQQKIHGSSMCHGNRGDGWTCINHGP